ncbi:TPA: hypothetical protein N0F65_006922, partial [Lagenidium giganteum]
HPDQSSMSALATATKLQTQSLSNVNCFNECHYDPDTSRDEEIARALQGEFDRANERRITTAYQHNSALQADTGRVSERRSSMVCPGVTERSNSTRQSSKAVIAQPIGLQHPFACGSCGAVQMVKNVADNSSFTCTTCGVENRISLPLQQPQRIYYV